MNAESALGKIALASAPSDHLSGVRLLPNGSFALRARLDLIHRAESAIDLQYYLVANDPSGRAFLRALAEAAKRGTRVRLLLDDLYTADIDQLLVELSTYPNIQVRVFNPFAAGRRSLLTRLLFALDDLPRINRRMHNKLMIADAAFAIAGGRNVADEYFNLSKADNFVDDDLLVAGPVVSKLEDTFDLYWNSSYAFPIQSLEQSPRATEALQGDFESATSPSGHAPSTPVPLHDVLGFGPIGAELDRGRIDMIQAPSFVYADYPSKLSEPDNGDLNSASYDIISIMHAAHDRLVISAPYFIPGANGMALILEDRARGIDINVLTNSLSSNDALLAHIGYARYRMALLRAGIELYELSGQPFSRLRGFGDFRSRGGGLHAKQAVIDGKTTFIGSINLDPRSAEQNTELGLVIESPEIAQQMLEVIRLAERESAYRLRLTNDGESIEWLAPNSERQTIVRSEPEAGLLERILEWLLGPLAPEEEL